MCFINEQTKENEEKQEFVDDYELMVCLVCHKPHCGCYAKCPHCGSGTYNQVGYEIEDYTLDELKEKLNEVREYNARSLIAEGKRILKALGIEE
jgi:hypothetical protein